MSDKTMNAMKRKAAPLKLRAVAARLRNVKHAKRLAAAMERLMASNDKMDKLDGLIWSLDGMYPGFVKRLVKSLLENHIRGLLPEKIATHTDFERIFSGERYCFGTEPGQMLKYDLLQCRQRRIIPFDGFMLRCYNWAYERPTHGYVKKAMAAYLHFWYHAHVQALAAARNALMDRRVAAFDYTMDCLRARAASPEDIAELAAAADEANALVAALVHEMKKKMVQEKLVKIAQNHAELA